MLHFVCGVLATYGLVVVCGNMKDKDDGKKYLVKVKVPSGDTLENITVWDNITVPQLAKSLGIQEDAKLSFGGKIYGQSFVPTDTELSGFSTMQDLGVRDGDTLVFVTPKKSEEIKDEPKNKTNSSVGCNCFGLFQICQ